MSILVVLLLVSTAMLWYTYSGYPLLLRLAVWWRGPRPVRQADITPPVTLVISAYNEEAVIASKLENALALDYPRDRLSIVVVSDASSDRTDDIVRQFADRGVRLERQPARQGKTAGLNRTVPRLPSDIVVFSDANAMYQPDALRMLVRNFADPDVGCVTGEARYTTEGRAAAQVGERIYWGYEMQIKRLETSIGSMVGGDGAIYAIRKDLWRELPADAINDFLNPLQIVASGWRVVYEPHAVANEETAGTVAAEYRRRVRIVSRSWRAVFQAYQVLNPMRVGLFAWKVISHKVLRWLSGIFLAALIAASAGLYWHALLAAPVLSITAAIVLVGAVVLSRHLRELAIMAAYFATINAASLVGVGKGSVGRVSGVWTSPVRHAPITLAASRALISVGPMLVLAFAMTWALVATACRANQIADTATLVFWASIVVLVYVYFGYPVLLALMSAIGKKPIRRGDAEPSVCLFITANDEESVIQAKLENAIAVDYPAEKLQIVVASDGSVDQTNAIVRRFAPRVTLFEFTPRRGKIAAINDGVAAVTSEIVVFSDANTFLARDAIRELVANFADEQVGAVSGDVILVGERADLARSEDLYYTYERWLQQAESEIGSMIGADGALYAIRRSLFLPPANDTILDDMAIPMAIVRARRRVVFEPRARAVEQGSDTAFEEFARKSRVIAGAMQFMTRRDSAVPIESPQVVVSLLSHKVLRWLSPCFAACAGVAAAVLGTSSRGHAAFALAQAGLLGAGALGCIPALRRNSLIAFSHYFCLVQVAAVFGFMRGLARRQSVLWRRFGRERRGGGREGKVSMSEFGAGSGL